MITVFGSINVDMVMQVAALPQPGETVLCPGYLLVPGGKGANQALAAARDGAAVRMAGCVGRDRFAETALSLLHRQGVDLSLVSESSRPTCCAAVWIDNAGENAIVVASGANLDASANQIVDDAFGPNDTLVLQMEIPHEENWAVAKRAKARGAQVILSVAPAAPVPESAIADLDMILVNQIEGAMVAKALKLDIPAAAIPGTLAQRFGLTCVMTLGSQGAIAATPKRTMRIPALPVSAIDTTAAGDAFAGVLAAALDAGRDLENALRRASIAAGLACTHVGAQTSLPDADAIEAALSDLPAVEPA
jgi:ribokinase